MGKKATTISLTPEERDYLETQTRSRTIQAQTVCRARILLLKSEGEPINSIADKVGINRCSVMLCLKKFKEGGVENALFDAPGRGRNAEITDDDARRRVFEDFARRFRGGGRFAVDHEIVRLQVLMDVAFPEDVGKPFDDIRHDFDDGRFVQLVEAKDEIFRVQPAGDVFHDEKDMLGRRDDVVAGYDVRMVERRHGARLGDKPVAVSGKLGELAFDHLDGDIAVQAYLPRKIDGAHPADSDAGEYLEAGQVDVLDAVIDR